ncbi:hypothetical protein [Amycolatopsis minnesotensis]|uniref:Uncharacterized protein n=1 Tax=Amycolatopsis minnesotensis TaxID=337894 RepID=A0ABN2QCM8_9PSEU
MNDIRRRNLLRTAGATALGTGAVLAGAVPAAAAHPGSLIGTWRGTATRVDEIEVAVFTFFPGGIFTSFAEGIHISAGRWAMTGHRAFRFSLWQVLPDDLEGLPHRYHGEVQAIHHGRIDGDTLTTEGVGRRIDADGEEIGRGWVRVHATRFGLDPF